MPFSHRALGSLRRQVYQVMRGCGIRPDNRSTLLLVKLCRANDMAEVATEILRERSHWPERLTPQGRVFQRAAGSNVTAGARPRAWSASRRSGESGPGTA